MINRKEIKKQARKKIKRNYWRVIATSFLIALLLGNLNWNTSISVHSNLSTLNNHIFNIQTPHSVILNETLEKITNIKTNLQNYKPSKGILANVFNNVTHSGNFLFGLLNSFNQLIFHERIWASALIFMGAILSFLYWFFIKNTLKVGESRFFLENRNYPKTHLKRALQPFRVKKLKNTSLTMFQVSLQELLYFLTIVYGFIIHYSYRLVPFILAENPGIPRKQAIQLSTNMMVGYKWECFKLDLSFLFWNILDLFTFHLLGILYLNSYKSACFAEIYMKIRNDAKEKNILNSNSLCDTYLEQEGVIYPTIYYIYKEKNYKWLNTDYNRNYSPLSLALMFFTASIIGWLWEVGLHLFQYGSFVNRGTLHGPWIPIYGWGVIFLLILLKKIRKHPILTFLFTMIICGFIEYTTGWYLETFKNARYWDYDHFFLNLHGRICLEGLLAFGIGGCAFIYFAAPLLDSLYANIKPNIKLIFCISFALLFLIDNIYSNKHPNTGDGISEKLVPIQNTIKLIL